MNDVLDQYRAQWPGLFRDTPDLESVPKMIVIGAALIHRELGNEKRAEQLLEGLRDEWDDPFATQAMALAHLGESGQAINVLTRHIEDGGNFDYLPGDPFWAPLAEDNRFRAIVEKKDVEAAHHRTRVEAMIASGDLVLPGQQEYHASMVNEVRN